MMVSRSRSGGAASATGALPTCAPSVADGGAPAPGTEAVATAAAALAAGAEAAATGAALAAGSRAVAAAGAEAAGRGACGSGGASRSPPQCSQYRAPARVARRSQCGHTGPWSSPKQRAHILRSAGFSRPHRGQLSVSTGASTKDPALSLLPENRVDSDLLFDPLDRERRGGAAPAPHPRTRGSWRRADGTLFGRRYNVCRTPRPR